MKWIVVAAVLLAGPVGAHEATKEEGGSPQCTEARAWIEEALFKSVEITFLMNNQIDVEGVGTEKYSRTLTFVEYYKGMLVDLTENIASAKYYMEQVCP